MIYLVGAILLLIAGWFLLMSVRAMFGSALGTGVSSSAGITLDEQDASSSGAYGQSNH